MAPELIRSDGRVTAAGLTGHIESASLAGILAVTASDLAT
jgi:hypothetical protein